MRGNACIVTDLLLLVIDFAPWGILKERKMHEKGGAAYEGHGNEMHILEGDGDG